MEKEVRIDEINEIMTTFLNNVVETAKIHTQWKATLGEEHDYTKLACSLVSIFNQYQTLYVYMSDPEQYARDLVELSNQALVVLSFTPYELMSGNFFQKRKNLKKNKKEREEAIQKLNQQIDAVNESINQNVKRGEAHE